MNVIESRGYGVERERQLDVIKLSSRNGIIILIGPPGREVILHPLLIGARNGASLAEDFVTPREVPVVDLNAAGTVLASELRCEFLHERFDGLFIFRRKLNRLEETWLYVTRDEELGLVVRRPMRLKAGMACPPEDLLHAAALGLPGGRIGRGELEETVTGRIAALVKNRGVDAHDGIDAVRMIFTRSVEHLDIGVGDRKIDMRLAVEPQAVVMLESDLPPLQLRAREQAVLQNTRQVIHRCEVNELAHSPTFEE